MREQMQRYVKIGGIAFGVLFVLLAGLVIYLKSLDFNDYKPQIQAAVLDATGRTLSIDGQLTLSISLHPALLVEDVHLSNAKGGSRPSMADIERLEVEVRFLPLLFGNVDVERLIVVRPDILLETLPDGGANWVFASAGPEASGESAAAGEAEDLEEAGDLPQVHHVVITQAQLTYLDAKNGVRQSLNLPKVELWEDSDASDAPLNLRISGQFNAIPLALEGKLSSVGALAANERLDVVLRTAMAGAELNMAGSVEQPLEGKGLALNVNLDVPDMAALAGLAGVRLEQFPLHFKGLLKDSESGFDLSDLQLNLGKNDVTGNVQLALIQPRPRIHAALHSNRFSLDDILPAEQQGDGASGKPDKVGAAGTEKARRVFPAEPLDLEALQSVDADMGYKADMFVISGMQMSDMDVRLQLSGGVLKIAPFRARLGGGSLNMRVALLGARMPAGLDISLTGRKIMSGSLLEQMGVEGEGGKGLMQGGSLNVDVSLKGKGRSVADIMGASNGRIKLHMGKARVRSNALNLVGGDMLMTLADKLNPFSEEKDTMDLQCGVVHFRVENGMMLSEDGIAFETARMNILSEGSINLHDESIDLSFGTEPREGIGLNLSNMANVVKLGGTLAEPGIVVDVAKSGKAAARTAGAVMTGGLSLLGEGLYNRATADSSPCKTALEMK